MLIAATCMRRRARHITDLGAGTLRFDRAAHGMIGSSPWFFSRVASAVVRLLLPDVDAFSQSAVSALVREYLRY